MASPSEYRTGVEATSGIRGNQDRRNEVVSCRVKYTERGVHGDAPSW